MITVHPGYEALALTLLISDIAPDDDQKAALAEEISNDPTERGYAGKTPAEILALLCQPYGVPNSEEQGVLPKVSMTQAEVRTLHTRLSAALTARAIANVETPPALVRCIDQTLWSACNLDSLSLTDPATVGMLGYLVAAGALTQAEADAITSIPDPSYQATIYHPSRISVVWGAGLMPSLDDVAEAMA